MFVKSRQNFAVFSGDANDLREARAELYPDFPLQEELDELILMRKVAREWGIGPKDHAYPDLAYVQGAPPTREG